MPRLSNIRVLSISDDGAVRSSRELILRRDGYEIVSITSDELLSVPEIRTFDVAVMCHSVAPSRAFAMVERMRRYNPEIRVLRVNPRLHKVDPIYDVDSESLAGPGTLLKAVKSLLDRNAAAVAHQPGSAGHDEYCGPFAVHAWSNSRGS